MEMASKINIDYFNLIFNTTISTRLKSTEPKAALVLLGLVYWRWCF